MADEKAVRKPRGTPIDRGIRLMQEMDNETLRDYAAVVRGFSAARVNGKPAQAMLELGERAAEDQE